MYEAGSSLSWPIGTENAPSTTNALIRQILQLRCNAIGKPLKAHTMLVHVSQRKADQARIAGDIATQIDLWRAALDQGQDLKPLFAAAWEAQGSGVDAPGDTGTIFSSALSVLRSLVVLVLNSDTGEELEYEGKPGRHIIAVGGNRLSRGLTLEGLTISYFLRTATMCDTLLQMARWYGFRHGYDDLIRIWTTDGIARWFGELALVEQAMRDSIQTLDRAGRRPDQMAIRLRAHSDLLLTARNKVTFAVTHQDSWSGEHPQTILLPLNEVQKLVRNRHLADSFLRELAPSESKHGGLGFIDQFSIQDQEKQPAGKRETSGSVFIRSPEVRQIALHRADGRCEWCGQVGFTLSNGAIYLETHHIIPLSEGGVDHERNVAALCPNHHREAHFGRSSGDLREGLQTMRSNN